MHQAIVVEVRQPAEHRGLRTESNSLADRLDVRERVGVGDYYPARRRGRSRGVLQIGEVATAWDLLQLGGHGGGDGVRLEPLPEGQGLGELGSDRGAQALSRQNEPAAGVPRQHLQAGQGTFQPRRGIRGSRYGDDACVSAGPEGAHELEARSVHEQRPIARGAHERDLARELLRELVQLPIGELAGEAQIVMDEGVSEAVRLAGGPMREKTWKVPHATVS